MLKCQINRLSLFDRKHYDYPDLPHGYQITQYKRPFAINGQLDGIGIDRIQIEMDSAKIVEGNVDLNRAGVGLLEIVTPPVLRSALDSFNFVKKLHSILKQSQVCHGNLEDGQFRIDVNVSVTGPRAPVEAGPLGIRVELKNLNSFTALFQAIEAESKRQIKLLEAGEMVKSETRGFDPSNKTTFTLRSKEEQQEYRFIREHDLPPLIITEEMLERVKREMPKMQDQLIGELVSQYPDLNGEQAIELLEDPILHTLFDELTRILPDHKFVFYWLTGELAGLLNKHKMSMDVSLLDGLKVIIPYLYSGQIGKAAGRSILSAWLPDQKQSIKDLIEPYLGGVSDEEIRNSISNLLAKHPAELQQFREGSRSVDFFMGPLVRQFKGQSPKTIRAHLLDIIKTL